MKKSLLAVIALLFLGLLIIRASTTVHARECWWEILIELTSKGTYTLEEADASYSGNYAYTIQWSGCMEQDGEDFILYHEDSDLIRWTPQEKKKVPGSGETQIKKNFSEKPSFAFNYILTKKDNIHFDFLVRGFRVPQQRREKRYYLHFPASKENSYHPTDIAYNLHIYKGSNQVYLCKDDLLDKSVTRDFHWSWKRHSSEGEAERSSYLSHGYDVDVRITILKHLKE
ncbi:MAG: hypothetical protein PVH84_02055 [Candidatus Aminicenantes bacterium]